MEEWADGEEEKGQLKLSSNGFADVFCKGWAVFVSRFTFNYHFLIALFNAILVNHRLDIWLQIGHFSKPSRGEGVY